MLWVWYWPYVFNFVFSRSHCPKSSWFRKTQLLILSVKLAVACLPSSVGMILCYLLTAVSLFDIFYSCLLPRLRSTRPHSVPLAFLSCMHSNPLSGLQEGPCNHWGLSGKWSPVQSSTWLAAIQILSRGCWFCGLGLAQLGFLCPCSTRKALLVQKVGGTLKIGFPASS